MVNKNLIKLKEILDKSNVDYDYNKILKDLKKDLKNKRYGLIWEEHEEEIDKVVADNIPILKEEKALRIENTKKGPNHIIIEGDNLLGLRSLEISKNKVDVIYIDPPYNTGNEFVYNDKLVSKEDSYRHSKWLSFMNNRLKIARNLLADDGIIFISIDSNEQAQLKLLMDEVFGEENFVGDLIRKTRGFVNNSTGFNLQHENTLVYAKKTKNIKLIGELKDFSRYSNPDNDKKGDWRKDATTAASGGQNSLFPIENPYTGEKYYPSKGRYWAFNKKTLKKWIKSGKVVFPKEKGKRFYIKKYKSELASKYNLLDSLHFTDNDYVNAMGTRELRSMDIYDFNYPKPSTFIKDLLKSIKKPNAIVLDFFAGSGTTLQAVMELNKEDGGSRQCILINNNEVSNTETAKFLNKNYNTDFKLTKAGKLSKRKSNLEKFNKFLKTDKFKKIKEGHAYKNLGICRSITYERSKKIIKGYRDNKDNKIDGLDNNNLYYYEIKLLSKNLTEFEVLDRLETFAVELIKIKHDAFYLKEVSKDKDRAFYTGKEDVIVSHKIYVDDDFTDYVNKRITDKPMNVYIDESLLNDIKLANLNTKNIYPIPEKFINWEGISRKESIA